MFIKIVMLFILSCGNESSNSNKIDDANFNGYQDNIIKKPKFSSLFLYRDEENGELKELKPDSTFKTDINIVFNDEHPQYRQANEIKSTLNRGLYFIVFKIEENGKREPLNILDRTEVILDKNGKYLIYAVNKYHANIMFEKEGDEGEPKIELNINK